MTWHWRVKPPTWCGIMIYVLTVLKSYRQTMIGQTGFFRLDWNCSSKWGNITNPRNGQFIFPAKKWKLQLQQHQEPLFTGQEKTPVRCAIVKLKLWIRVLSTAVQPAPLPANATIPSFFTAVRRNHLWMSWVVDRFPHIWVSLSSQALQPRYLDAV